VLVTQRQGVDHDEEEWFLGRGVGESGDGDGAADGAGADSPGATVVYGGSMYVICVVPPGSGVTAVDNYNP
jgi:hypothetical protein